MNHALYLNLAIILAVIVGMVLLQNPLVLFALLLLKELPYGLLMQTTEEEEDESKPIGFVQ